MNASRFRGPLFGVLLLTFLTLPLLGQTPTGTLTGKVTSDGDPLPGVTVTVQSPALQGTRTVISDENGAYHFPLLPPGEYTVRLELEGFAAKEEQARVPLGQVINLDVQLVLEGVTETIVVTGAFENVSSTTQSSVTYQSELIEKLPVNRDIRQAVLLAPAAGDTGPNGNISISGNMSFENLFLVNGVVITENIRGQPFNLFIEDSIEETTISSSGVSAEYGRFSGGVVNTITKSGGDSFHGSVRSSFDNQKWEGETPLTVERDDTTNSTLEGTLGGYVPPLKEKLWFFAAVRDRETEGVEQTNTTAIPFDAVRAETRLEGKLTFSINPSHRLVGTYLDIDDSEQGNFFGNVLDLASLNNRETPQELQVFHYSGVVTPKFFLETQYSEREFLFVGSGSQFTDLIRGTLLVDRQGRRWNSPTFCGVCRDEERSNENLLLKASYFLSPSRGGTHDIVGGYDTFSDIRAADNHQSGSDFRITTIDTIITGSGAGTVLYPRFTPGVSIIQWNPIFVTTKGTDFETNSFFVNDTWRATSRLSVNLGARFDDNDGKDAGGATVIDDNKLSPRLGATYDFRGDGDLLFHASAGRYVMAVANSQAGAGSAAGSPASLTWFYNGPDINPVGTPEGSLIPTDVALGLLWDWFESTGFTDNPNLRSVSIPGGQTVVGDDMKSPHTDELTLGVSKRIGRRGTVRADYVRREGADFYIDRRDLVTGRAVLPSGQSVDKSVIGNSDDVLERVYDGLHTQARFRFNPRLEVGGVWAWSHSRGTWDGETGASGPVRSALGQYPEYRAFAQHIPRGDLGNDQRHRARLWATWQILERGSNRLSLGVIQNYKSGTPYSAAGNVDPRADAQGNFGIPNPGYATPPSSVTYFFGDRGAFTTDSITATDLALNYSFRWNAFGRSLEVYLQPRVTNVFNEDGVITVDTTVLTRVNDSSLARFNPFTETPIEGVHWKLGDDFGKPLSPAAFQLPRTFLFSAGFRF
jgi:hypothetical protein